MELAVTLRTHTGKRNSQLRRLSIIPGVVYGKHTKTTTQIAFDKNAFLKLFKQAGTSSVVDLKGGYDGMVLIHDYQTNPITNNLLHVDFLAVNANEEVKAEVPVILIGESPLVKGNEGRVTLIKDSIAVSALPKDLPHNIEIDISKIASLQDDIFVRDLNLGTKVRIEEDMDQLIVAAVELSKETEETPAAAPAAAAPAAE